MAPEAYFSAGLYRLRERVRIRWRESIKFDCPKVRREPNQHKFAAPSTPDVAIAHVFVHVDASTLATSRLLFLCRRPLHPRDGSAAGFTIANTRDVLPELRFRGGKEKGEEDARAPILSDTLSVS